MCLTIIIIVFVEQSSWNGCLSIIYSALLLFNLAVITLLLDKHTCLTLCSSSILICPRSSLSWNILAIDLLFLPMSLLYILLTDLMGVFLSKTCPSNLLLFPEIAFYTLFPCPDIAYFCLLSFGKSQDYSWTPMCL